MVSTGVTRSDEDAFVRASTRMRERFAARVMAAESWTDGVATALSEIGDSLVAEMGSAQTLQELWQDGHVMRWLYEEERPERLAAIVRAWRHHHPGGPVPEVQLEVFVGAVSHLVDTAVQRGDVGTLSARLPGLTVLAPMAAV